MPPADSAPSSSEKPRITPEAAALYQQGNQHAQQGNFPPAAELYRQAVALSPDFAEAHNNLANALRMLGELPGAVESYRRCLAIAPNIAQVHRNLATALMTLNRGEEACPVLERVIELTPHDDESKEMLRLVKASLGADGGKPLAGRTADAAAKARAAALCEEGSEALAKCEGLGPEQRAPHLERAHTALRQAIELDPSNARGWHQMGLVAYQSMSFDAALELISRAIAIEPDISRYYFDLGNVRMTRQQWPEAIAAYQHALRIEPKHLEALNNLGNAYRKSHRVAEAESCYLEALEIDPDVLVVRRNLAIVLLQRNKRPEALIACRRVLERDPNDSRIRYMAGFLSGESNDAPPPEFVTALFDEYSERFEKHLTEDLAYHVPEQLRAAVGRLLGDRKPNWSVLDLGCGTGLCGRTFRDLARRMAGVDLSPKMIEKARACGAYDDLHTADVHAMLDATSERFDLIVAADVLIYLGDVGRYLQSCLKALSPEGWIVFSTEKDDTDTYRLRPSGRFTHGEAYVRRMAEENGLTVVGCEEISVRTEEGKPVPGQIFVLARRHAGA